MPIEGNERRFGIYWLVIHLPSASPLFPSVKLIRKLFVNPWHRALRLRRRRFRWSYGLVEFTENRRMFVLASELHAFLSGHVFGKFFDDVRNGVQVDEPRINAVVCFLPEPCFVDRTEKG